MKQPVKRHLVDIFRVPLETSVTSRGQRNETPTEVASDVPCSIESLSGRELEAARQLYAEVQYRVRLFGLGSWNLTPADYLVRDSGGKRMDIGHVMDQELLEDYEYTLLCSHEYPVE